MPKQDILTGYLNVVEFSGNVYGVGAAAQAYFGTTADKLTVPQAALLAGMVNNPNLYNPYTHPRAGRSTRRNTVIDAMVPAGSISPADGAAAKAAPLGVVPDGPAVPGSTCHVGRTGRGVLLRLRRRATSSRPGSPPTSSYTGGYTITTTMDPAASQVIKDAVDRNVPTTQDGVANTFALIKPGTTGHQVLAMVANRNLGTDAAQGETLDQHRRRTRATSSGRARRSRSSRPRRRWSRARSGSTPRCPTPARTASPRPTPTATPHCYPVRERRHDYPDPISLQDALATSPNVAFVGLGGATGHARRRCRWRSGSACATRWPPTTQAAPPITDPADPLSKNPQYNEPQSKYFQGLLSFTLGDEPGEPAGDGQRRRPRSCAAACGARRTRSCRSPTATGSRCAWTSSPASRSSTRAWRTPWPPGLCQGHHAGHLAPRPPPRAGWHRPDIGKTGTTNQSESVAFVGGVDGYAAASMVFADGPNPQEICPGNPVHLGNCGHGAFGGTVAAPPYFAAMNQILAGQPDVPVAGPDPAYLNDGDRVPIVPYVVGQAGTAADAGPHRGRLRAVDAVDQVPPLPPGQVVGQSPQGNLATGATVTLWTSAGK